MELELLPANIPEVAYTTEVSTNNEENVCIREGKLYS